MDAVQPASGEAFWYLEVAEKWHWVLALELQQHCWISSWHLEVSGKLHRCPEYAQNSSSLHHASQLEDVLQKHGVN